MIPKLVFKSANPSLAVIHKSGSLLQILVVISKYLLSSLTLKSGVGKFLLITFSVRPSKNNPYSLYSSLNNLSVKTVIR